MEPKPDLRKLMWDSVASQIGDEGIYPHPCISLGEDGKLTFAMFDLTPDQVYTEVCKLVNGSKKAKEIIFGLDRHTKPGQGTKYDDAFVCGHFHDGVWDVGVINYIPTRDGNAAVVDDWDWNNEWWQTALRKEIEQNFSKIMVIPRQVLSEALLKVIQRAVEVQSAPDLTDHRPENLTQEQIEEWTKECEKNKWSNPFTNEVYGLEVYLAGNWLDLELEKIGCSPETISKLCSVAGQRTYCVNPWDAARLVLNNYVEKGLVEEPGEALAKQVTMERIREMNLIPIPFDFKVPPNISTVLKFMVLFFALLFTGCPQTAKQAVESSDTRGEILPDGAENIRYSGDEWIVFDWTPPEEEKGTYIVHWPNKSGSTTPISLTQIVKSVEQSEQEYPEGPCPVCGSNIKFTPLGPVHLED